MPAVNFSVQWPDGEHVTYYSPSTVIHQYFEPDSSMPLQTFLSQVDKALAAASERVYQRFGYYCTSAAAEQEKIQQKARELAQKKIDGNITYELA